MRKVIALAATGLLIGASFGSALAWWIVHPHDSFSGGGLAAMTAAPVGGVTGLLLGVAFALRSGTGKGDVRSRRALLGFAATLPVAVAGSVIGFLCLNGMPLNRVWQAFSTTR